ncbi:MAG: hypothetical protein VB118_10805 [Oscillospiraceae bacterium]|nr:hypothetical protein [Oscillospiraceae bacterium]
MAYTKKMAGYNPICIKGRAIAKSWWGQAWCNNLELYADYVNRIARGKAYVRNGSVIHLAIEGGTVTAKVQGSKARPYNVSVNISPMSVPDWDRIKCLCQNKIGSLTELAEGKFPAEFAVLFTQKNSRLFPSPKEIKFSCSCPDWACMCKHVAAVLYGIGARFDDDPMLFFTLRGIDVNDLIKRSINDKVNTMLASAGKRTERTLENIDICALFGDDIVL